MRSTAENTGNVSLTSPVLTFALAQNGASLDLTSGASLSGDDDNDSILDVEETWTYTATLTVDQANFDKGGTIESTAIFDSAETDEDSDTAESAISQNSRLHDQQRDRSDKPHGARAS